MKGNDFYYNPSTNEMELKSNPSPLRPKEEDHPAEKHYEGELNRIEKRGKSWLVKHLKKEIDVETTDKKTNKPIIYVAIAALVIIVLFFMNG